MDPFNEHQWASYSCLALELFKVLLLKPCCCRCLVCIVISAVQSISSFLLPGPQFSHPCDFITVSLVDLTVSNPSFLLLQNKIFLSVNLMILLQLKSPIEDSSRLLSEILHDWTTSISQPTPPLMLLILSFMNSMCPLHTLYSFHASVPLLMPFLLFQMLFISCQISDPVLQEVFLGIYSSHLCQPHPLA